MCPRLHITVARYNTFQTNLWNEKVCLAVTKRIVGWEGHGGLLIIQQLENEKLLLYGSNKMISFTTVSLYTGVHIWCMLQQSMKKKFTQYHRHKNNHSKLKKLKYAVSITKKPILFITCQPTPRLRTEGGTGVALAYLDTAINAPVDCLFMESKSVNLRD